LKTIKGGNADGTYSAGCGRHGLATGNRVPSQIGGECPRQDGRFVSGCQRRLSAKNCLAALSQTLELLPALPCVNATLGDFPEGIMPMPWWPLLRGLTNKPPCPSLERSGDMAPCQRISFTVDQSGWISERIAVHWYPSRGRALVAVRSHNGCRFSVSSASRTGATPSHDWSSFPRCGVTNIRV